MQNYFNYETYFTNVSVYSSTIISFILIMFLKVSNIKRKARIWPEIYLKFCQS